MEQPIACTLTPDAYRERAAGLAALAARALRSRKTTARGARLTFADSPETEADLRAAVAAEAACCAFLRMDLQRRDEGLVLDIAGPEDARAVVAGLFEAAQRPSGW